MYLTYFNGAWAEGNAPLFGAMDHSVWLGSSVFDGARSLSGHMPDLRLHLQRVIVSAERLGMKCPLSVDEMEQLVREGVAYARSIHGSTEESRRTNLDSFLDSLVFDYQDMGKEVQLSGKSEAVIDTRPHALRRVLVNLTDNALKFAGAAELLIQRDKTGLSIKVMDRGPGIAEEELAQVMEPFYRVENSRNRSTGGTGLGLVICKGLAELMGGEVGVESSLGKGSLFWFTARLGIDRQPVNAGPAGGDPSVRSALMDALAERQGARILLVEDNDINQQVASELLAESGFIVEVTDNGQQALDRLSAPRCGCARYPPWPGCPWWP